MLFVFFRSRDTLRRALRDAVATHRAALLRELCAQHGERAFAAALSGASGRVIADVLSMLGAAERARVHTRLSRRARRLLAAAGGVSCDPAARFQAPRGHAVLVWGSLA
jgi:hypothetical protein